MGKSRKSTGKRQRFNIFKRDGFTCQYCGRTPPTVVLVIDHILPVASGGGEEDTNKITSCEACNQGKAAGLLTDTPRSIAETLAEQVNRREQLEEFNRFLLKAREREDKTAREIGHYWFNHLAPEEERDEFTFGSGRLTSVRVFLKRLPTAEIYDAIDIAFRRITHARLEWDDHAWKYFCGVCWKKIREREKLDPGAPPL